MEAVEHRGDGEFGVVSDEDGGEVLYWKNLKLYTIVTPMILT